MSQGADTLKMAPSAPPADSPLSNDPLFKVSEGSHPDLTAPETEKLLLILGCLACSVEAWEKAGYPVIHFTSVE